jgi:hypothetical protein
VLTRARLLIAAALLLATTACGNADAVDTDGPAAWKAYDAKMATWVECLRANGLTDVRYMGHNTGVVEAKMELEGIPQGTYLTHEAWERCRSKQPTDTDRPVPFLVDGIPPEELKELRAVAKCMRGKGFTDFPEPDATSDPQHPTRYDNAKENPIPGLDQAWKDCRRELGLKAQ